MILYPTRNRLSKDDYRTSCVDGEAWKLIDSIATGKRAVVFLPGSLAFGSVGFLGIFPGALLLSFVLLSMLQATPASVQGSFIFIGATITTVIHCAFMFRVSLGHLYAQQDLVRYLKVLLAASCGFIFYSLLQGLGFGYLLLSIAAALLAGLVLRLSRSVSFSLYADLMRVKRLYLQERDARLKAQLNRGRRA
jgi:hypothetical protein